MFTFHIIPNAHIDPVWLWDAAEGLNQSIRTARAVLDLMDEFPFLTFMRGESVLYSHLEKNDPETFRRVLERIRDGRWEVVGGTYLQTDTNLPSAMVLARNFEIGLSYCKEQLGVRPRTAWAADSFGHCAGYPDILAVAGMENFGFTRPFPATMPTPKPAFWWRGPSGGRILCYRPEVGWYGTRNDEVPWRLDAMLAAASADATAGRGFDNVPVFVGVGDHGGGPSRRQIRQICVWAEAHPEVRVVWSGLQRFFDALRAEAATKGGDAFFPEIEGELGYTLRGCYTSGARVKFAFRHAESELAVAERITSLVTRHPTLVTGGCEVAAGNLASAWRSLLFNAFHDILPGSCIERAAAEQLQQLGGVRQAAREAVLSALNALARQTDTSVARPKGDFPAPLPFLLFNPHPWALRGQVELEGCIDDNAEYFKAFGGGQAPLVVRDAANRRIPFQIIPTEAEFGNVFWRSRAIVEARIPALGFAVYTLGWDTRDCQKLQLGINDKNENTNSENPVEKLRVSASPCERIASARFAIAAKLGADGVRILRDGKPWLKGKGLQALLFRDPKGSWGDDAARQYDESMPPVAWKVTHAEITENGPLRSALFVRLAGERSWLELTFRLAAGRDAIDCDARLLWNERASRLKLSIPCGATATEADVPGAVARRAAALGEVPCRSWIRALDRDGNPAMGFASDALCGYDALGGAVRPSVVRATGYSFGLGHENPLESWRTATDLGEHRFRFLLAPGDADLPRLAEELEAPPAALLAPNSEPGPLGRSGSLAALRPASFRLLALKPAEDGSGDLVLRVQETAGRAAVATFVFGGRHYDLGHVAARAIAIWRLPADGGPATLVDASERP